VPVFPSEEWVEAWVALANQSAAFEASGTGWEGAVGVVIEADPDAGVPEPLYVRLEGRHGKWVGSAFGTRRALLDGSVFVLRAPYRRWKDFVRQDLHPLKGVLQGKVRIEGHLPAILKWTRALTVLAELAGQVETEFVDEQARRTEAKSRRGA
jgi:putative sterol carrier protein